MEKFFDFLKTEMTQPLPYGGWHLFFVCLTLVTTVVISLLFKKCDDKTFRKLFLIFWLIMVVFEIYKETIYYFENWQAPSYKWALFPYQFCSTPFFIFPFIIWLKDGKVRDAFIGYTATFVLFAGIGLMSVPTSFCQYVGINIQTMVHHGIQVVLGVFVAVHERKKFNILFFLRSLFVLLGLITLAILMNEFMFPLVKDKAWGEAFNMFYISRHVVNELPVLASIWHKSYTAFILTYIIGFSGIGFVLFAIEKYIPDLVLLIKNKIKK